MTQSDWCFKFFILHISQLEGRELIWVWILKTVVSKNTLTFMGLLEIWTLNLWWFQGIIQSFQVWEWYCYYIFCKRPGLIDACCSIYDRNGRIICFETIMLEEERLILSQQWLGLSSGFVAFRVLFSIFVSTEFSTIKDKKGKWVWLQCGGPDCRGRNGDEKRPGRNPRWERSRAVSGGDGEKERC